MQITRDSPRGFTIETSRKSLRTPFFFPAISAIKSNYEIYDYLNLLRKTSYPGFLISSYDIYNDEKSDSLMKDLSEITEGNIFLFMDSGNYEAYWNNDTSWTIEKFQAVLKKVDIDLCFSFDVFWEEGKNIEKHVKETIKNIAMTAAMQKLGNTVPIIHFSLKNLAEIIKGVVEDINPQMIGVTERELGAHFLERAKTVKMIREELDSMGRHIPLHLLGTGNPIALLVYALSGADSFDGLEWRDNVVNPENGHLYHFTQKDLVVCNCKACEIKNIPYHLQVMSHNLIFYERFMLEIRKAIEEKQINQLLNKYLPKTFSWKD